MGGLRNRPVRLATRDAKRPVKKPRVPEDLLEHLEAEYPQRCKMPAESLEGHLFYSGAAHLVQVLRLWHDKDKSQDSNELYPMEVE